MAVDVGNSRVKLGHFRLPQSVSLPLPQQSARLALDWTDDDLARALPGQAGDHAWYIASVNRPAADRLIEWLERSGVKRVHLLTHADLPLAIDLAQPERVGLDRLADAVAANCLRTPNEPVIVVDHGSAIKVDLVDQRGAFAGGAILPGINMSARALHEFTDRLPLVDVPDAPAHLDRSTIGAIRFGLAWGAVGAVRELIGALAPGTAAPQVLVTGGGARELAAILGEGNARPPQFVPHLTLAGIAVAAAHHAAKNLR